MKKYIPWHKVWLSGKIPAHLLPKPLWTKLSPQHQQSTTIRAVKKKTLKKTAVISHPQADLSKHSAKQVRSICDAKANHFSDDDHREIDVEVEERFDRGIDFDLDTNEEYRFQDVDFGGDRDD